MPFRRLYIQFNLLRPAKEVGPVRIIEWPTSDVQ